MTASHETEENGRRPVPVPRLRTKLTVILVVMLGIACLIIGVSSYITLKNSLMGQIVNRLDEASNRAVSYKPAPDASPEAPNPVSEDPVQPGTSAETTQGCGEEQNKSPLDAPGQAAGTLSMCLDRGTVIFSGVLDKDGNSQPLSSADIDTLRGITADGTATEVSLETGSYLVEAVDVSPETETVVVTGIPLRDSQRTLATLVAVMAGGSAAVMVSAGWLGSWIIRRTMQPLERVSAVATGVARSNLETELLPKTERVMHRDANPNSEVGAVGYALNQLLDNVQYALEARQHTEDRMRAFVADASHELRTPLAAIRGYSDLIRWTEELSESGQQSVERIDSQTRRMSRLVEDLLLLAHLDEGRDPVYEKVDLTELLVENVSDFRVAAPDHVWQLELPREPVEVLGDRNQLQQVLLNMLSNARKHTVEGTRVTAGLRVSATGREVIMTVVDEGQGIDPEFIGKIFDRFSRADEARSGSDGTTGLGLPIAKAIVEAHGGAIEVSSRPGRTEFAVRLPLTQEKG